MGCQNESMPINLLLLVLVCSGLATPLATQAKKPNPQMDIWWEAETTRSHSFGKGSWLSGSRLKNRDVLSEGDWLTFSGKIPARPVTAKYDVRVERSGTFTFWTRKFWKHGPFRWRFGHSAWTTCGKDCGLHDTAPIQENVCANWVSLGTVDLKRGSRVFEIQLIGAAGSQTTACFDVFLLAQSAFSPDGKLKPGEKSGKTEPGFFAFEPDPDTFEDSLIDLRYLNEKVAGQDGHVRARGNDFVLASGKRVRFWGVNLGPGVLDLGEPAIDLLARSLAKRGVNLVRFHGPVFAGEAKDPSTIDKVRLAKIHHLCASLKAQGIYLHLSFYFPLWFKIKDSYGIPGYSAKADTPFALLFLDKRMQGIYRAWARGLLTPNNPHTGLSLAADPSVLLVEVLNEDSLFFWTFNKKLIPSRLWKQLNDEFSDWSGSQVELKDAWHMTTAGRKSSKREAIHKQVRFLAEKQRQFYAETIEFFRKDLGVKSLVSCSNWHTSDPQLLNGIERWTYSAGDVMDQHMYFGGEHKGNAASYSVAEGHQFTHRSALREPMAMPLQICGIEGFPGIVSEIGWPNPNRFKAEYPLLSAVYGSLQGLDGLEFFALHGAGWETNVTKFPLQVPTVMGQFPAFALAYRRGDIKEGEVVALETSTIDKLVAGGEQILGSTSLDALRRRDVPSKQRLPSKQRSKFAPEAWFVGRVSRAFDKKSNRVRLPSLPEVDRSKKRIESRTGEISWEYGKGILAVDSPRFAALGGFLRAAGPLTVGGFEIRSDNEYASIAIVSLDGLELSKSKRILVQCMTEEKLFGWREKNGRIENLGATPMLVRHIAIRITKKKGKPFDRVTVLDTNGYHREVIPVVGQAVRIPKDAIYCLLERN